MARGTSVLLWMTSLGCVLNFHRAMQKGVTDKAATPVMVG